MTSISHTQDKVAIPRDELLYGALLEQSAVGIALGSIDGRFLRANAALCRMLGFGEQELLQKSIRDITHPEDLESNQQFRDELLSGKSQSRTYEKRYLRKDGSPVWGEIVGSVVRDKSGAPQCLVALVHDITELKVAQQALEASEARLRRLFVLGSDWYWVQDEHLRFIELPGVEKRGFGQEAFVGRARWEIPGLGR